MTPRDKNRSLGFSPGNLRPPSPQQHRVFQPEEVGLTPPDDFCPPRQECSGYGLSQAPFQLGMDKNRSVGFSPGN